MSDAGKLYIVGTPIGNLSDFSPRGIETLKNADYIAAEDTRVTMKLLGRFGISKPLLSYYKPREEEKSAAILEKLLEGFNVALVSDAGMPCISDPGEYLVRRCAELGIKTEVVPSCNAAIAAVAISGISTARFAFEGFLPTDNREREKRLSEVKALSHTLVYYEAPHKLKRTLSDMERILGDRTAALCRELTKIHEEVIRGTLGELCALYSDTEPRGEYVIVVEGAREKESAVSPDEAAEVARGFVSKGEKLSDACKEAAKITGVPRREIYRLLTEGSGETERRNE